MLLNDWKNPCAVQILITTSTPKKVQNTPTKAQKKKNKIPQHKEKKSCQQNPNNKGKKRKEKKKRLLYLLSNLIGKIPQNKDNYRRQRYLWFGFFCGIEELLFTCFKGERAGSPWAQTA